MASQSLPPPPLTCGTPPPMDFGSDDDEYPYDEHFDDAPSFDDDDGIPVPAFDPGLPSSPLGLRATTLPVNIDLGPNNLEVCAPNRNELKDECNTTEDELQKKVPNEEEPTYTPKVEGISPTMVLDSDEEVKEVVTVPQESNPSPTIEESRDSVVDQAVILEEEPVVMSELKSDNEEIRHIKECPTSLTPELEENIANESELQEELIANSPSPIVEAFREENPELENIDCVYGDFVENTLEVPLKSDTAIGFPSEAPCDDKELVKKAEDVGGLNSQMVQPIISSDPGDDNLFNDPKGNQLLEDNSNIVEPESPLEEDNDFAADFQQFANFDSFAPAAPSEIQEFHSNVEATKSTFHIDNAFEEDDDDDFGDFTSSAPAPTIPETVVSQPIDIKIPDIDISTANDIFMAMFTPVTELHSHRNIVIEKPLVQIKGFETTALTGEYQWTKSCSNKCLVKCLGIDSRNILHGTNWNPEMPRFAANLGFTPLQPIKPTTPIVTIPNAAMIPVVINNPSTNAAIGVLPGDVPAAQFDWDSSGLVNPLNEGTPASAQIPKEDNKRPEAPSPTKLEESNRRTIENLVPEKTSPLPDTVEILPTQFTSPLRETHIFTPITGVNPVSREVNPTIEMPPENIVVKEYRDVEYDPLKFLGEANIILKPEISPTATDIPKVSETTVDEPEITVFKPPDTAATLPSQFSIDDDEGDDFSEFQSVPAPSNPPQTNLLHNSGSSLKSLTPNNVNPLQPLSVTNLSSMVMNHTNSRMASDILKPSILMPQAVGQSKTMQTKSTINPEIRWSDNQGIEIGKSELDRIEELFSKRRETGSSSQPSVGHLNEKIINQSSVIAPPGKPSQDEDEWTDFVSGVVKPISAPTDPANGEDEWSDFVSSAPSGPNFTPWQTPSSNYQIHGPSIKSNDGQPELRFVDPSPFFISSAGLPSMFGGVPMETNRDGGKK